MEIYGEKGARILNLFCKFKFEKETNQHYQDKIVNSSTKKGEKTNRYRGLDPGSKTLSNNLKVKQLNRYVTGSIASEV